jgi:amino acid transporter
MTELRRSIPFAGLVLYGLGTTIGAGIYALTGVVAGRVGWMTPLAFAAAAALALFTALAFAELSSRFPRAGGEAVYVLEGFRSRAFATAVGLLVVTAGIVSAAAVTVAFAAHLAALVAVPPGLAAQLAILAIGALAAWGVRESVLAADAITLIEIGGLLAVIAWGAHALPAAAPRLAEAWPRDGADGLHLAGAAVLAFYAFLGFEDMVNVAEEVRDVRRVLPRAILTTLAVTLALYVAVAAVALAVVPPDELARADAPLVEVFERSGGAPIVLNVIALFALLNGVLIQLMKAARVLYGMARDGALPALLGRVHPGRRTPLVATALVTAVAAGLAALLPLATLAELTASVTLLTFGLANAALLVVKRRDPRPEGAVVYPAWVPAAGVVASVGLLSAEIALRTGAIAGG